MLGGNQIDQGITFQANADELELIGDGIEINLKKNASEAADGFKLMGQGFGVVADDIDSDSKDITGSVKTITDESNTAQGELEGAGDAMVDAWFNSGRQLLVSVDAIEKVAEASTNAAETADDAGEKTQKWIKTIVDGVPTYEQAAGGIAKSNINIAESASEAQKKSDELLVKLEQIASEERIATIEANVELNIAGLEADAKSAVSIIETLGSSIESTAALIGDLFGIFADADTPEQRAIFRQIDLENKNREKELDLQELLIKAQVRNLEAKTEALREGNGLITIQADGLEPELEAFMMAVLRRVQIKAAEDQSLYLLGLPAVAP